MKNDFQSGFHKGLNRIFKGFTLAELIVVITILAILATIGFLALTGYTQDARASVVAANVRSVQTAISAESAITGNSPRYYVLHDSGAALSGAFVYVDGSPLALTGGDWNASNTNYSAGNPDYVKLKLNKDKFKIGYLGLDSALAAYDAKYLVTGAVELVQTSSNGTKRPTSWFQVAGVDEVTKKATVSGNYPTSSGSVSGLIKNPSSSSSSWALVEGAIVTSVPASAWACGTAAKSYASTGSTFGTDTFCADWTLSATPAFPNIGGTVSWTCTKTASTTCTASRAGISGWTFVGNALPWSTTNYAERINYSYSIADFAACTTLCAGSASTQSACYSAGDSFCQCYNTTNTKCDRSGTNVYCFTKP